MRSGEGPHLYIRFVSLKSSPMCSQNLLLKKKSKSQEEFPPPATFSPLFLLFFAKDETTHWRGDPASSVYQWMRHGPYLCERDERTESKVPCI